MAKKTRTRARTPRADADDPRIAEVRKRLARAIPRPFCELDHGDAWQLLVATILSAQSTDRTVNAVTPELFRLWPTPEGLAEAPRAEVERVVKRTGFFRSKAKAIQEASRVLVELHGGEVPRDLDLLVELPGVARKTANVVLGTAYGIAAGIVVDTHVARVAGRLALTGERDAAKIERDLMELFPRRAWVATGHRLLLHGRYVCTSRAPKCARCPLNEVCPAAEAEPEGAWTGRARSEWALVESRGRP